MLFSIIQAVDLLALYNLQNGSKDSSYCNKYTLMAVINFFFLAVEMISFVEKKSQMKRLSCKKKNWRHQRPFALELAKSQFSTCFKEKLVSCYSTEFFEG